MHHRAPEAVVIAVFVFVCAGCGDAIAVDTLDSDEPETSDS